MGAARFQRLHYLVQHRLRLLKYLVVPKPQDEKSLGLDQEVTLLVVVSIFLMLPTIEFDDNLCLEACKVCDKTCDRHLPSKSVASDLSVPKLTP